MLIATLENVLNRGLPRSPRARQLVSELAGTTLGVHVRGIARVLVSSNGAVLQLTQDANGRADAELRGGVLSLLQLAGPAPEWAVDVSKLYASPVPNLSGQMQLARVIVGRAEARAAAKDARAEESLRAAFALTGSLRGRPEIVSQLFSIAATRLELAAVRRIPVDAPAWRERLKTLDPRGGLLMAFRQGAWVQYETAKRLREVRLRAGPPLGRLAALSGAWRGRVESAAHLDAWRATIEAAAKSPVEDAETKGLTEVFQAALQRSGERAMPAAAIPNLLGSWRKANVLALEIRKTDEALAARASKP